ncbi:TnsA-like heteromeric transposase endonuclease subunit [Nonomuraea sp. NPDC046570]|uniref:TnsA-like heteromeric transposase endonuclease subunit n=1 Tax=Nonomuraea sp. NPDC046570 TaxID=3155255 RepID=UPI0033DAEF22
MVGIAAQPFWLFWTSERGKGISHAPDYFARLADGGGGLVLDCRPLERIRPRDAMKFAATESACEMVGWDYRVVGAADAIKVANVRWLATAIPRHRLPGVASALREPFCEPTGLMAGAEKVGDPIAVLPVLFDLLWRHDLERDLAAPLHPDSVVTWVGE